MKRIQEIINELHQYYANAGEARTIISDCALVAAGATALGSAVPVLSVPATIASCVGAVGVMYTKLCKTLNIRIRDNSLRVISRAALADIAGRVVGAAGLSLVGSMVPGVAAVVSAGVTYVSVYLAGMVFLALLARMAAAAADPHDLSGVSTAQMAKVLRTCKVTAEDVKAARRAYTEGRS